MNKLLPSIGRGVLFAFLASFLATTGIYGQIISQTPALTGQQLLVEYDRCGTMHADSVRRAQNPNAPSLMDFENWLQQEIAKQQQLPKDKSGRAAVLTIPVIVHVIHNGDAVGSNENISATQIYSQIDVLNEDFRRQNADTTNTPSGFRPVAADVEIEFCPALRDPQGNVLAEPGIHRVQRSESTWSNTTTIDNTLKPATIWDPNQYFNIWTVDFGGNGLLGYAQFPEGSGLAGMPTGAQGANSDGVVVLYNAFGRTGNVTSPYNRGRTTTHEVGHWLGLRHIWGDGGCGTDDFCADTPESDASNRGCPTTHVSCGTTDMVQNYMDYTNDACMNIFTQNQKSRMQTVMAVCNRRVQLLSSTVCTPLIQVTVTGQVRDATTLQGVPNAQVRFLGVGNNFSYNATADANGNFTISVNQGTYNVYGGKWGYVTAQVANRTFTAPSGTVTIDIAKGYYDDFIMNFGWTTSGSATTGAWQRGAPIGTTYNNQPCAPGADVTNDFGSDAYVTGNGGGAAGDDDVDGTPTILTSPVFDLTTYNLPYLSYYRWWYNDGGNTAFDDSLTISVTNGITSVVIDRIGPGTNNGNSWSFRNYNLNTLIAKTANMRFIVTTGDYGQGHLVEAGLDLFRVVDSLPNVNQPPTPLFTATNRTICTGQTVTFSDVSAGNPTSRLWTFAGGTPATSTAASPTITYNAPGTYNVTLQVTNAFGTNTLTQTGYVTVTSASTDFTSNITQGCGTLNIQFTDQSTCATAWQWSFPGGIPATSTTQNPSVSYSTPGSYDVTLVVNGITQTKTQYITVGTNATLLNENFESNSFATNGWTIDNPDNGTTWVINTVAGNAPGDKAVGINLFNYTTNGQRDRLVSPMLNLSNVSNTQLSFKHAHRRRSQSQRDSLIVYVSTDGGLTWPNRILAAGESGTGTFATNTTVNANFVPTIADDWCGQGTVGAACFTLNLGAFDGQANVRIRFESFNNLGNNIYLDDILVTGCQLVPTAPPVADFSGIPRTGCGSVNVQFTDLTSGNPTSWEWSFPGGTPATASIQNPSVSYTTGGTYPVTLIAINSAGRDTIVKNSYITVNATPSVTITPTDPLCAGQSNGSALATATGGTGPYSYVWSNNRNTANNSSIPAGTYVVTVTDANGCTATASTTLNAPTAIAASASTTPAFCGSANGSATLTINGGTTPYTVAWSNGGSGTSITGLAAGSYGYTITDNNGCTRTGSATITSNTTNPTLTFNITNVSCNGGNNGAIVATATGGTTPYTFTWGNGSSTGTVSNLTSGNYTVTVTDANGCSASTSVFVSQPAAIAIGNTTTPATCGNSNGSATATVSGGTGPYTYAWSGGGTTATISNRPSGSYTVTVTDSRNCTATATVNISNVGGPTVTVSKQDVTCNGGSNGSATATVTGGSTPYTYTWSGGGSTASISNRSAGTYTVTVTDANNCSSIATVTINQPTAIAVALTAANSSCGVANGTISSTVSGGTGPYTYAWSNGGITANINSLTANNYTVTVTDSRNCTATATATVGQQAAPTVTVSGTDASCFGLSDGTATATVAGGTQPYSYNWSGGFTGQTVNTLNAGNFTVTITDASNCTVAGTVTIGQPTQIVIGNTVADATCGGNDGSITTNVSGGTPAYDYLWSSGSISSSLSNLASGAYELTVTDQNGCYADTTIVVSNIGGPTVTVSVSNNNCTGQNNGSASVSVNGGTAPYSYNWSNGSSSSSITNLASGNYTVTVTDATGCVAVRSITIQQPATLQLLTYKVDATCGITNGQAGLLAAGGVGPYTYSWSGGSSQQQLQNLPQGVYNATVTDANGCQATASITIDSLAELIVSANVNAESCVGNNDGSIAINISSGVGPYSYAWSNGLTVANASNLTPGNYNITITDASGCVNEQNLVVSAATPLSINSTVLSLVCGNKFGEVDATATGGISPYSYIWSTGDAVQNLLVVIEGTYTVTATDANGCQASASSIVPRSTGPAITTYSTPDTLGNGNGTATVVPISGNGPYVYAWDNGQTTSTATGLSAGSYVVSVTDGNGCETKDTVNVGFYTSIADNLDAAKIALWPNPTNGKFVVSLGGLAGIAQINVYDALGKLVIKQENDNLAKPEAEVDLSTYADGVYMVRISHEGQMAHFRLVLAK